MKKVSVLLCFDDGRRDVYYNAVKELIRHKIPATFSIITSFIEGGKEWPGDIEAQPMTIDNLLSIHKNCLFEIANHSDSHSNEWKDIQRGKEKLFQWMKMASDEKIGFSSPGSKRCKEWLKEHELQFREAGYEYVRTGGYWHTKRKIRILCRKISRVFHSGFLFAYAYEDTLLEEKERYVLTAVPIMNDITLHQIKSLIRYAESKGKTCILLFHSILPKTDPKYHNPWVWDAEKFSALTVFLKQEYDEGRVQLRNLKQYAFEKQ